MKTHVALAIIVLLLSVPCVQADLVEYVLGVDDYGDLYIDGQLRAHYDGYPQGGDRTGVLDLANGWHDIEIIFKNRWGSNVIGFYKVTGPNPSDLALIAREDLRSTNADGDLVQGLRGDYYDLTGNYLMTVYGEGPIYHGWSYQAPLHTLYQGVHNTLWAGTYDGWGRFEERMTGQILVGVETIRIPVDIKPGSCDNPLNIKSKGVLPVAILGTEELDVYLIDPVTLRLEGIAPVKSSYEDVATPPLDQEDDCACPENIADGLMDLILKFSTQDIVAALPDDISDGQEIVLTLTGQTYEGVEIEGTNCVLILDKPNRKND